MVQGDECHLLACDFDGQNWQQDARAYSQACEEAGVANIAEISRSGDGAHIWIFFQSWVPAGLARNAGMRLLRRAMELSPSMSLKSYDRFFPAQDSLPTQAPGRMRLGNLIALPLQGDCRRRGTTVFCDPRTWAPYEDQFAALASVQPTSPGVLEKIGAATPVLDFGPLSTDALPLKPPRKELKGGLQGKKLLLVKDSVIHLPTAEVPAAILAELKHRASIWNPEFYRRQAQRFSTFGVPRVVTSFEHDDHELRIPRGLGGETRQLLKNAGAEVTIRRRGKRLEKRNLEFQGELRPAQQKALRALLKHQEGVLVAPPGSGKTVIACGLIAERQLPTAILVNRAELLQQWRERLLEFLNLEDKQIGQLGSGRKKRKGLVDLIMLQSISRRGSNPAILEEYGHIIIDECHTVAAPSTEAAIRTVNVKHWTGLTATPFRADQMDGLITMQCGPIRHEMKPAVSVNRTVMVHESRFTTEESGANGPSIQAIYSELSLDPERNKLVVDEVSSAAGQGRSCLVLTNRVDHLKVLAKAIKKKTDLDVFTLHGQLSSHDRREVRNAVNAADAERRPFVLIAIDKVAGEGLDWPSLNTLFLTMPVSFKGRVIQQAGRVTRSGEDSDAVVHDFRDPEVPLLEGMFRRRRNVLQKEGFVPVQ